MFALFDLRYLDDSHGRRLTTSTASTPGQPFSNGLKATVRGQLLEVLDPCRCMSDHPVNIVDLGLIEATEADGGTVDVTVLLTSQRCTYFLDIHDEISEGVAALPAVDDVEVRQDTSGKIWTHARMSERERTERHQRFTERMEAADITPSPSSIVRL
ncbi:metal-sulfur cluster assembly factor [Halomarina ordinaria]|uniref:Metal-sulfur cluster assembly factor n=1 Tax=Halomarina ordinaria TaxID=3033939 RepID=A0ABD5UBK1_9EURY|nr:iron-sulfur cluster assembly protein [Halomarina sp. PSRA2]